MDEGYPKREEFIDRFIPYMYPAGNSFVAASSGFLPPDFTKEFHFIDLGCGRGKTLMALAQLYPQAEFYGVDFNEKSISFAQKKAEELRLKNLRFINTGFEKLLELKELPFFDYVSMAGLYTWLTPSAREAVKKFVEKRLKPEGILYLEFAAIPGSINNAIFWRFIRELVPREAEDSEKIEKTLELFEIFISRPTKYLITYTGVRTVISNYLRNREEQSKHLLHNVLPEYAFPVYFFEIYDDFTKAGVRFAGRMDLEQNAPELSLFPSHVPTYVRFKKDVRVRETVVDFILNIGEHHDVWVKEGELKEKESLEYLHEHFFLIPRQKPDHLRRTVLLPGGHRFSLSGEIFTPFYGNGEAPFRLGDHPLFKENPEAVKKAFYKVSASGEFFICCFKDKLRDLRETPEELPERFTISSVNEYLLESAFELLTGCQLVSEVTGGVAVTLSPLEVVLFYFALKEGKGKALDSAFEYLQSLDKTLRLGGEEKKAKDVSREDLEKIFDSLFKGRKIFNLNRLNIVA
ncbi:MAG: methyltransferase domain-containing protein [Deltaproteobacteria bacterium]|nr:methyltransferase domain-containing protein [Deltaproteobacteria bacterium]